MCSAKVTGHDPDTQTKSVFFMPSINSKEQASLPAPSPNRKHRPILSRDNLITYSDMYSCLSSLSLTFVEIARSLASLTISFHHVTSPFLERDDGRLQNVNNRFLFLVYEVEMALTDPSLLPLLHLSPISGSEVLINCHSIPEVESRSLCLPHPTIPVPDFPTGMAA